MRPADERGMALLAVLILVAVMSALAVSVLDDIRFGLRRTANAQAVDQARWHALGAETLAKDQIRRLAEADLGFIAGGGWNGRVFRFPIEGGTLQARLRDGSNCFNLNSLVQGQGDLLQARGLGARQFVVLMTALGLPERQAELLAAAATDWIDADQMREAGGAEDEAYARGRRPYRTSGALFAEVSELRAVRGFAGDAYRRLRPHVCALPTTDLSPIDVNTLSPDQAVLLTMLTDGALPLDAARRVIERRPPGGWRDLSSFWGAEGLAEVVPGDAVVNQVALRPRFFLLDTEVVYGDADVVSSALFENVSGGRPRLAARRWTRDE